ncbi:hypothetical protein M569_16329, partial [Genlisea aurea]
DGEKGLIWRLPEVKSRRIGKLGPAFGVGVGCGVGLAVGLIGGTGFGLGLPSLQLGFGFGAGCGIGVGFGYGLGKGIAYDESRRLSNIGHSRGAAVVPLQDDIGGVIDELVVNTKKLIEATSREMDKWRR